MIRQVLTESFLADRRAPPHLLEGNQRNVGRSAAALLPGESRPSARFPSAMATT